MKQNLIEQWPFSKCKNVTLMEMFMVEGHVVATHVECNFRME